MQQEKIIKKQAGVLKEVKGSETEPRVYPGTEFKPGQKVLVTKYSEKEKIEKGEITGLNVFLKIHDNEINTLRKEFDNWFKESYPPHPGKIAMDRSTLFFQTLWKTEDAPTMWDNAYDILDIIHILDNLDMSAWKRETQIKTLVKLIYPDTSVNRIYEQLYPCDSELDIKKITLKKFVEDTIKDTEPWWLKTAVNTYGKTAD